LQRSPCCTAYVEAHAEVDCGLEVGVMVPDTPVVPVAVVPYAAGLVTEYPTFEQLDVREAKSEAKSVSYPNGEFN